MAIPNVDWKSIRPIDGSRGRGFEELCCQLARVEAPAEATFVRKGDPDAGVECFAQLHGGDEWGWQAKYFDGLGDAQFRQLDASVQTALERHPRLVRYFVCVPLDRADARTGRRKSQLDRWNEHVHKWQGRASKQGLSVEFGFWGSSELLARLAQPEHAGRLWFFFDKAVLDKQWFLARLYESIRQAGARYTPKLSVDVPVASALAAVGRTDDARDTVLRASRAVRRRLSDLKMSVQWFRNDDAEAPEMRARFRGVLQEPSSAAIAATEAVLSAAQRVDLTPGVAEPLADVCGLASSAAEAIESLRDAVAGLERAIGDERLLDAAYAQGRAARDILGYAKHAIARLAEAIWDQSDVLRQLRECVRASVLVLDGDAGVGKTHLLCDVAVRRLDAGLPTVLLLGGRFTTTDDPWRQALSLLDLGQRCADEFLGALEAAAQASGHRALLIVDALNEGEGPTIWPKHLASFVALACRSPWIALVLSVRTCYRELVGGLKQEDVVSAHHQGFAGMERDAASLFLRHYGLDRHAMPMLHPEFGNPLFLKLLCQGLKGTGQTRLPTGATGIECIYGLYASAVNTKLANALNFDPRDELPVRALRLLAEAMAKSGTRWIARGEAKRLADELLPGRAYQDSLFRALVAEGLVTVQRSEGSSSWRDTVVITYDRWADHLIAQAILARYECESGFRNESPDVGALAPGVLSALCLLVPERWQQELHSLVYGVKGLPAYPDAFLDSVMWRRPNAATAETKATLKELLASPNARDDVFEILVTLSPLAGHPISADHLDELLRGLPMAERDELWSTYVHRSWENGGGVHRIVDWAWSMGPEDATDEETVRLAATSLAWVLTTPNRFARDRATKALVALLTGHLQILCDLIERFVEVDDPYVAERIAAVAYGCVLRSRDREEVSAVAQLVYDRVFGAGPVRSHLLLRDYARGTIERAISLGCTLQIGEPRIRPPYGSDWPEIPSLDSIQQQVGAQTQVVPGRGGGDLGLSAVMTSVLHDDFGRYVIGTNHQESDWVVTDRCAASLGVCPGSRLDLSVIQRYVLGRVFDLGWTTERFSRFDAQEVQSYGRNAHKSERMGKKYQWLAYHEMIALVADNCRYSERFALEGKAEEYDGPWQLFRRDIDPSCILQSPAAERRTAASQEAWWVEGTEVNFDPNTPDADWVLQAIDGQWLRHLLVATRPADQCQFVVLDGFHGWRDNPPEDYSEEDWPLRGAWCMLTGYLVRNEHADRFLEWCRITDFGGRWMPEPVEAHHVFIGEHYWSPADRGFGTTAETWREPREECPTSVTLAARHHVQESADFDCSVDEGSTLRLPSRTLAESLGVTWTGSGADFSDPTGTIVAFDPSALSGGPSVLLAQLDPLRSALGEAGLALCWALLGERSVRDPVSRSYMTPFVHFSGACLLSAQGLSGFVKHWRHDRSPSGDPVVTELAQTETDVVL